MKSKVMHAWLEAHINVLERGCGQDTTIELRQLLSLFRARETASIQDICTAIERSATGVRRNEGIVVARITDLLGLMITSAAAIASAAVMRDFKLLSDTLHKYGDLSLQDILPAATELLKGTRRAPRNMENGLSDTAFRDYVRRLEEALGDEQGFEDEYSRLAGDDRVKAPDVKRIAKAFAGKSGRSRSDALGLIAARQQSLVGARAKANATDGRSAA